MPISPLIYYMLAIEDAEGLRYWCYGNPGNFSKDTANARYYARKQSAINARSILLKRRKDVFAETLKVLEVK